MKSSIPATSSTGGNCLARSPYASRNGVLSPSEGRQTNFWNTMVGFTITGGFIASLSQSGVRKMTYYIAKTRQMPHLDWFRSTGLAPVAGTIGWLMRVRREKRFSAGLAPVESTISYYHS